MLFGRTGFVRHIEPAKLMDEDVSAPGATKKSNRETRNPAASIANIAEITVLQKTTIEKSNATGK